MNKLMSSIYLLHECGLDTHEIDSYGQSVNLSDVSLNAGDVLVVRARARSTSYKMYVANLVIVQTS